MSVVFDLMTERDALRDEVADLKDLLSLALVALAIGGECWFEVEEDGDGWNEPRSEAFSCGCGEWSGTSWVQVDRNCTGRPGLDDLVANLREWRDHYEQPREAGW